MPNIMPNEFIPARVDPSYTKSDPAEALLRIYYLLHLISDANGLRYSTEIQESPETLSLIAEVLSEHIAPPVE